MSHQNQANPGKQDKLAQQQQSSRSPSRRDVGTDASPGRGQRDDSRSQDKLSRGDSSRQDKR